jgi:hypothetical protein
MDPQPARPTTLKHSANPIAAYSELPNACFRDQESGEQIEVLLRRHIITNLRWIIPAIVGLMLPTIVRLVQPASLPGFEVFGTIPRTTVFIFEMLWYVIMIGYVLENFLIWYYNVYLITSLRLVDVDFIGLLEYSSTEAELHQIQDIEHKQVGLWQLLFNYGTVEIQTAGIRQNLIFEKVPKPSRVTDIITDLLPEEAAFNRHRQPEATPVPKEQVLS